MYKISTELFVEILVSPLSIVLNYPALHIHYDDRCAENTVNPSKDPS